MAGRQVSQGGSSARAGSAKKFRSSLEQLAEILNEAGAVPIINGIRIDDAYRLENGFLAVDQLNSWVRSESFRDQHLTSMLKHIYALKRKALETVRANRRCTHQRMHYIAKCRTCDGTGTYTEWDTMTVSGKTSIVQKDLGRCRRCWGAGKVQLDFICTSFFSGDVIREPIKWHTPREMWPFSTLDMGESVLAEDWTPNKPGKDLTVEEAAYLLLIADREFPLRCMCQYLYTCEAHYDFHVGRVTNRCVRCGGDPGYGRNYGMRDGRVRFTVNICEACHPSKDFPTSGFPLELQTEFVSRWIERNKNLAATA